MSEIIKINNATFDISELRATKCKFVRKNLSPDEFILEVDASSPAKEWAYDDTFEFWQNNVRRFKGKIAENKKLHSSATEHFCIIAKNGLYELEQIIFQQPSKVYFNGNLTTKLRSKVILGMNELSTKISIAEQATKILQYAIEKNADIQIGNISIKNEMLFDECVDLTCAEALYKILKWAPDCFVWFDYSGNDAPLLNIASRSNLTEKQVDTNAGNIADYSVNRRDDLSIKSVAIKYERENTRDDYSYLELIEDVYPPNAETGGKKSIVMNVELSGSKTTCQKYSIKTKSIQENSKQWWKDHLLFLNELSDFEILATSRTSKLSNELIEGTIVDELNLKHEKDNVKATISYTDEFGSKLTQNITIKLIATSASTATFTRWRTQEYAEPAPSGLAKAIFNATNELQYNGHIKFFDEKVEDFFGKKISIQQNAKFIAENMPPYYAVEDIFNKTLLIKFGPPQHLYPDDIVELFRINRTRKVSNLRHDTQTGRVSASTSVSIGGRNPENILENNVFYSKLILQDEQTSKTIDIDTNVLQDGQTASFQDVYLYANGNIAQAKILMSPPISNE